MNCNHKICKLLYKKLRDPSKGGAGCLILTKIEDKWVALLGFEKYGTKNKNKLNLCAGGRNPSDNGCFVTCALRELKEEFKIELTEKEFFRYFTDHNTKKVLYSIMGGVTPIFIGVFPYIDIQMLNENINYDNKYNLDPTYREMAFVDFVDINTKKQLYDNLPETRLTSFANTMINTVHKNFNFN
jgi:hypothetical protein